MMTNKQIKRYFKFAKNISKFSNYPKIHIGAIMVYNKDIIAIGYNTTKSNPLQKQYNKYRKEESREYNTEKQSNFLHAEMMCLISTKNLNIDWGKVSIFVYRELKDGSIALSKPCFGCMKAITDRGIKNIYYTTNNGWNYERREFNDTYNPY